MHGPTCIFWANLTPFSLKEHLLQPGAAELARQNAATNRTGVCPGTPACPGVPINYSPAYSVCREEPGSFDICVKVGREGRWVVFSTSGIPY